MAQREVEAIFISQPENRYYLSGFSGSAGFLLITPGSRILATDFRYVEQAKKEATDFEIFQIRHDVADWFPRLVGGLNLEQLGFEAGHITFARHQRFTEALRKGGLSLKLVPLEGIVESLRLVKDNAEIELITKAVAITDQAFAHLEETIHNGMSEKEAAWEIEKFMRENGSEAVAFDAIVAAGPSSALPHAHPSEHLISPGEPIVIDIGCKYQGYSSDLTRTIYTGTATDTFKQIYDIVLRAQIRASNDIRGGMSGEEADMLARQIIGEAGYGDNFGHGMGHGLGLAIHESPRLGPNSREKLGDGMVFSIEPGIYIPGWGGVRIEDTVVMAGNKVRTITKARKLSDSNYQVKDFK